MIAVVPGWLLAMAVLGAAEARGVVVEVEAGKHDRRAATVMLPWPDALPGPAWSPWKRPTARPS